MPTSTTTIATATTTIQSTKIDIKTDAGCFGILCPQNYRIGVALFYGFMSAIVTLCNKAIFVRFGMHLPVLLFASQVTTTIVLLALCKYFRYIEYEDFQWSTAKQCVYISMAFVGMVAFGLAALSIVSIPMYSALRKQTTSIVLVGEYVFLNIRPTTSVIASVMLMSVGALIAGMNDLYFDLMGYIFVGICCLVTAAYTVLIKLVSRKIAISTFGLIFYNSILGLPLVLLVVSISGEVEEARRLDWFEPFLLSFWCITSVSAFILNVSITLCTRVNSPLTTSITGDLRNLITDAVGIVAFDDVELTVGYCAGIGLSTIGALWYSWLKMMKGGEDADGSVVVVVSAAAAAVSVVVDEESGSEPDDEPLKDVVGGHHYHHHHHHHVDATTALLHRS